MKIGITGGIGSGKSYICNILKQFGYAVYNCDDEAKRLMTEHTGIIDEIRALLGQDAYKEHQTESGKIIYTLNKPLVASYLFANPDNASTINAIVHPVVKEDFEQWAAQQNSKHVFMECAILFESGFHTAVDRTILIYADEEIRLKRAMKRDNATEEQIRNRMKQQISGSAARERADYILDHNDYSTTDEDIQKCLVWINKNCN